MPSIRISKEFTSGIYYLTFTVKNWYYLFDRHNRFEILADSLQYCQKHKGLKLYAYKIFRFKLQTCTRRGVQAGI